MSNLMASDQRNDEVPTRASAGRADERCLAAAGPSGETENLHAFPECVTQRASFYWTSAPGARQPRRLRASAPSTERQLGVGGVCDADAFAGTLLEDDLV